MNFNVMDNHRDTKELLKLRRLSIFIIRISSSAFFLCVGLRFSYKLAWIGIVISLVIWFAGYSLRAYYNNEILK